MGWDGLQTFFWLVVHSCASCNRSGHVLKVASDLFVRDLVILKMVCLCAFFEQSEREREGASTARGGGRIEGSGGVAGGKRCKCSTEAHQCEREYLSHDRWQLIVAV